MQFNFLNIITQITRAEEEESKHILLGWEVAEWPAVLFVGCTK